MASISPSMVMTFCVTLSCQLNFSSSNYLKTPIFWNLRRLWGELLEGPIPEAVSSAPSAQHTTRTEIAERTENKDLWIIFGYVFECLQSIAQTEEAMTLISTARIHSGLRSRHWQSFSLLQWLNWNNTFLERITHWTLVN